VQTSSGGGRGAGAGAHYWQALGERNEEEQEEGDVEEKGVDFTWG